MFIFTNSRGTFYRPGEILGILKNLFVELRQSTGVAMSLENENIFSFDNEAFRYLAARHNGVEFPPFEEESYAKSWAQSVKELHHLNSRIVRCDLHAVQDTQSLNEAQLLIHYISRPIAEITRLIQENLSLMNQYEKLMPTGKAAKGTRGIQQKVGRFVPLDK